MKLISNKLYKDLIKVLPELIKLAQIGDNKDANIVRRCNLSVRKLKQSKDQKSEL